jgi:aerobic carbon-monoxide dehydrogenase medium subunit
MKPPPFVYHRPAGVDEALSLLAEVGADGKILAGGQSLVPLMSMRLAAPGHLIDINRLAELHDVRVGGDGVSVGAVVRHAALERHEAAFAVQPLLRQALAHVAHPTIRNRGTTVGSIAHADPAGEMTGVLALLGGTATVRSRDGVRVVAAADFFVGPLESSARPDELVTEVSFPALPPQTGTAWTEVSRRNGDYAICGVGALVTVDGDGRIASARAGLISVGPVPTVVDVSGPLTGQDARDTDLAPAAEAVEEAIEPDADIHATAEYRRHLAGVLTARALRDAARRAVEGVS